VAEANAPHRGHLGTSQAAGPRAQRPRRTLELPREHGFWAMLAAVTASALVKSGASPRVLVASIVVGGAAVFGAMGFGRSIRRDGRAQVLSSAALGTLSLPLDLIAGRTWAPSLITSLVWVSVFAASALAVRAVFARASARTARFSPWLSGAAVLLPAVAALFCYVVAAPRELGASLLAAVSIGALVLTRPSIKSLKPVGIALAVLHGLCAILLGATGT
jgi:hypothetical protein